MKDPANFDKWAAVDRSCERISERSLWLAAFAGVFWGIILAGFLFLHKTSKAGFWPPVIIAGLLWAGLLISMAMGYVKA